MFSSSSYFLLFLVFVVVVFLEDVFDVVVFVVAVFAVVIFIVAVAIIILIIIIITVILIITIIIITVRQKVSIQHSSGSRGWHKKTDIHPKTYNRSLTFQNSGGGTTQTHKTNRWALQLINSTDQEASLVKI